MREASYSQGSRTSSSVNVSPLFCSDLTWPGRDFEFHNVDPVETDLPRLSSVAADAEAASLPTSQKTFRKPSVPTEASGYGSLAFCRNLPHLRNVVRLTNAASAQSAPVPMRAVRTSAGGTLCHRVNLQPTTKLMRSRPKNSRSRKQRVSKARPASRRIQMI